MAFVSKANGVDDMVMLSDLSEGGINSNLRRRFEKSQIYTYVGPVLVSVNPFRNIPELYSERLLKDYRGKYMYELPPHVYALSDEVYRQLMQEGKQQAVIISGESGAGKTEASKKIMQYIAAASSNSPGVQHVKNVIIESNPLLEAFGNAKTLRNNNSSRFGKYMEIQFTLQGDPEGGRITNYLLEKSRVVRQTMGERNFHVFYQLLAGCDDALRREFNLRPPQSYAYLKGCLTVDGINDALEFKEMSHAMEVMGLTAQRQKSVLKTLAAIITLGNLEFAQNEKDEARVTNMEELSWAAYLLELGEHDVQNSIVLRTIESGSQRASVFKCPQNVEGAIFSRDALAKELYSRLFDFVVLTVNKAMFKEMGTSVTVGILDIYGFEIFEVNMFEQLCINFVNEKLQQIFIQLTLREEQEEYVREGIVWSPVKFFDNQVVCQLIEAKKPMGVFTLLDDVCNFPSGSDQVFHQKLGKELGKNDYFEYGSQSGTFTIKHYAGPVEYSCNGMLERNKDTLFNDLIDICATSQNEVIRLLFADQTSKKDRKRPTTAAFKIKTSINDLVLSLGKCSPHYIRCIKPNDHKRANDYDDKRCLHQVQYLGLLENVRVRRAGFAYRHLYRPFFFRYRILCDATYPSWKGSEREAVVAICRQMDMKEGDDFQLGLTKIFIRKPESIFLLEEKRDQRVSSFANRIHAFITKFALQRWFYDLQMSGNRVMENAKERRRASVEVRKFSGDYINFCDNFELKKLCGKEKVHFADVGNKYDRRGKSHRRVLLISSLAYYEISLEPNPEKDQHVRRPFVYVVKRRVEWKDVKSVILSQLQDGFMLWQLPDYDTVLECRRKTELLANCKAFCSSLQVTFSDSWSIVIKGGKAGPKVNFHRDATAPPQGLLKGRDVRVAPGEAKGTQCKVEAPIEMPKVEHSRRPVQAVARAAPSPVPAAPVKSPIAAPVYAAKKSAPAPGPVKAPVKAVKQPAKAGPAPGPVKSAAKTGSKSPRKEVPPGPKATKLAKTGVKAAVKAVPKVVQNKGTVRAIWAFEALNPDEMSLQVGDVITLTNDNSADWWIGELRGKTGAFPASYVKRT